MNFKFAIIVVAAVLAGCASKPYECELGGIESAKCASTEDAYRASRAVPNAGRGLTSVFEASAAAPTTRDAKPYVGAQPSDYPSTNPHGMPVFEQPKVFRPWLAPYVDAEGNLRSGEYGYFSTPGRWNYGTMRKPGNASGIQGPAHPDNIGFNPVKSLPKNSGPAKPAESKSNAGAPTASTPVAAQPGPEAKVGDITQPYQRITE